ncbi:MAG: VPLPA-CTERM sorting domain-containing protein [Planctomycetota bacterium]|nr:VPLPA-CTERM sorting domain-containing protein [Planctomycetota bacterium]
MNLKRLSILSAAVLGLSAGLAQAASVGLSSATATFSQTGFDVSAAIDGSLNNNTGWAIDPNEVNQSAVFNAAGPVGGVGGTVFTFTMSQLFPNPDMHTIGKFKLSVTTDGSAWNDLAGVTFAANPAETPVNIGADGTILLAGSFRPSVSVYTVTGMTNLSAITGFKLDVLEDTSLPFQGPGRQPVNGNFVLTEFQVDATPVPLPAAAWAGMALLGGLGVAKRLRRHA